MLEVPVIVTEKDGIPRDYESVSAAVPFAMGQVYSTDNVALFSEAGENTPYQLNAHASWPDGSLRWGTLVFGTAINARESRRYTLAPGNAAPLTSAIKTTIHTPGIAVKDEKLTLYTEPGTALLHISHGSAHHELRITLADSNNTEHRAIIDSIEHRYSSAMQQQLQIEGSVLGGQINLRLLATINSGQPRVHWQLTIHNPQAAQHSNGMWDLGDPGSVYFKSLTVQLSSKTAAGVSSTDDFQTPLAPPPRSTADIYQASSGGENWSSPNHIDHTGQVRAPFSGYRYNDEQIENGRARPLIQLGQASDCIGFYMPQFWQQFPKALKGTDSGISLELFPNDGLAAHELQGGESKTHSFFTYFDDSPANIAAMTYPLSTHVSPDWVSRSGALLFTSNAVTDPTDSLISSALEGENSFFKKREIADEYGWRNFGDIHADHESLYKEGRDFVSHYNNQYDPIYGFVRQYLLSADERWKELTQDLAQHVVDIDIYNTERDKPEYNGGLFWHTDHYLDAYSSSHRTYSEKQLADTIYDQHGGGPGGQHCYTTGLLYHYFLTGSEQSKQAVYTLTEWISCFYEGAGGILDTLLAYRNRYNVGYKNRFDPEHQYPLDRGTGNYMVALLDCFALSNDPRYLKRVEHIIRYTVHPGDDISSRNLDDAESTWFYTVFFQAVLRYMQVKEILCEHDKHYYYALESFRHYSEWMLNNEEPYLTYPEKLEYPNHTWVAQEIRKANLFYAAAYYHLKHRDQFLSKAEEFMDYTVNELQKTPTSHFSRIQAILMQNHGVAGYYLQRIKEGNAAFLECARPESPRRSALPPLQLLAKEICSQLRHLSITTELNWLKQRLTR